MNSFKLSNLKNIIVVIILLISSPTLSHAQIMKDGIAKAVGDSIESAFNRSDVTYIKDIFNQPAFMKSILIEDEDNSSLKAFNAGFMSANPIIKIFETVVKSMEANEDEYTFISYNNDEDDNYYLRFRFSGDAGVNYHEYLLEFESMDEYFVSDLFIYSTGQSMRDLLLPIYQGTASSFLNKKNVDQDNLITREILVKLLSIKSDIENDKMKKARKTFTSIPKRYKKNTLLLQYALQLVESDDDYLEILNNLTDNSQNKAAIFLHGIDKYFLTKEYQKSLNAVDSLDSYVADDYLDLYRGSIYAEWKKYDSAEKYLVQLNTNYPYLAEGYDQLLSLYNGNAEYKKALDIVKNLTSTFEVDKKETHKLIKKTYPILTKQISYKEWYKSKNKKIDSP